MRKSKGCSILVAVSLLISASPTVAEVERFALVVGHNVGAPGQEELRYAENDATKVERVLRDFGDHRPENVVSVLGGDANSVRRAIIDLNDRIRARSGPSDSRTALFVYYSGHADGSALQLGASRLPLVEIEKLVRGSPAAFRLLVLDACRSGALTRVKGARAAPPIKIEIEERTPNEGVVFLTAASENEDAQESDEIRGSFFTHFFVSGLLGAADVNGDGRVVLGEAYRYAYEHTLRASSRTLAGVQHPTFRYDFKGRGDLVLTELAPAKGRSSLLFPRTRGYLVFREGRDGPVVAEVGPADTARQVRVRPGRYFVRGRGLDFLLEGNVVVAEGEDRLVDDEDLQRIAYARLVRKGRGFDSSQALEAGYRIRTALAGGAGPCSGGFAGWRLDLRHASVSSRVGACRGSRTGDAIREEASELDFDLRGVLAWDLPLVSLEVGVTTGGAFIHQSFTTAGVAPSRWASSLKVGAVAGLQADLVDGYYLQADLEAQTYFLGQESSRNPGRVSSIRAPAFRTAIGAGKRW